MICKLLESLFKDHMVDFLVRHKLLNPTQHGFLKVRSCWIDERSPVDIIYLDFQKAFNKVPHQRLLKLKARDIINWIEQWLADRRQRVVVGGEVSNWNSVLSGLLGSLLFLIYINDLDDNTTSNILKLADGKKCLERLTVMSINNIYKMI